MITPFLAIASPIEIIKEAWLVSPPIARALWIIVSLGLTGAGFKGSNQGGNGFIMMLIASLFLGALILRAIYT